MAANTISGHVTLNFTGLNKELSWMKDEMCQAVAKAIEREVLTTVPAQTGQLHGMPVIESAYVPEGEMFLLGNHAFIGYDGKLRRRARKPNTPALPVGRRAMCLSGPVPSEKD